jgi:hypothetical protein
MFLMVEHRFNYRLYQTLGHNNMIINASSILIFKLNSLTFYLQKHQN